MEEISDLRDINSEIEKTFSNLKEQRGEFPVYALEHSLDKKTLTFAKNAYRSISDSELSLSIRTAPLPLIVLATEVGYRYRGTGTDFWPILQQEIGNNSLYVIRSQLTSLFQDQSEKIGLAKRGKTPWEEHFPHISWPIANAIAPLEIHRHIARSLRQAMRIGVTPNIEEGFRNSLRSIATGIDSGRFNSWINFHEAALPVCQYMLSGRESENWISHWTLKRLEQDLMKDHIAGRQVKEARRINTRKKKQIKLPPRSKYRIIFQNKIPQRIEIAGPVLSMTYRQDLISNLKISNDSLNADSIIDAIDLNSFLSGGIFQIGYFRPLPINPLFRGDGKVMGEKETEILEALQPDNNPIFRFDKNQEFGIALDEDANVEQGAELFILKNSDHPSNEQSPEVLWLKEMDSEYDSMLSSKNITVVPMDSKIEITGLPLTVEQSIFSTNFPIFIDNQTKNTIYIKNKSEPKYPAVVIKNSKEQCNLNLGEHEISWEDGEHNKFKHTLKIAERADIPPASIILDPINPSLDDLASGNFSILVSAPCPISNINLKIKFGDYKTDVHFDRVPFKLSGLSSRIKKLRDKFFAALQSKSNPNNLSITITGFRNFNFHPIKTPSIYELDLSKKCWKVIDKTETNRIESTLFATLEDPLLSDYQGEWKFDEFTILVPDTGSDADLKYGVGLGNMKVIQMAQIKDISEIDKLSRKFNTNITDEVGLNDIVKSLIAWSSVRVDNPIFDYIKRITCYQLEQATVNQLCGNSWHELEKKVDVSSVSPHTALFKIAERRGLIFGKNEIQVPENWQRDFFISKIQQNFSKVVPDLNHSLSFWNEQIVGKLDFAIMDAHEELREEVESRGEKKPEEIDIMRKSEDWFNCVSDALSLSQLQKFKQFILPDERWRKLCERNYNSYSVEDVIELLESSHVDARRREGDRWIGRGDIANILKLWINPVDLAEKVNWDESLNKALSDRQTSRAIRYAALTDIKQSSFNLPKLGD